MLDLIFLLSTPSAEKSAFEQALESNQSVATEERTVLVNGKRYREVIFEDKIYYLRFVGPSEDMAVIDCELNGPFLPHLDEISVKVKRARVFVSLLKETCATKGGQVRHDVTIDPRIGIALPDGSNSVIKNKKVYLSPSGPGFSGEW